MTDHLLKELDPVCYPPPPPIPEPPPVPTEPISYWNPAITVLLGVVFTPAWTGVMTAINGYRLGLDQLWRPVVVGVLGTLICFALPSVLAIIAYASALVLIWKLDLEPQLKFMPAQVQSQNSSLLAPCIAGVPLAIVGFLALLVFPIGGFEEPSSMDRHIASQSPNQQTAIQSQASKSNFGKLPVQRREEDRQNRAYRTGAAIVLSKLFAGAGGKTLCVLCLGLGAGLFKWITSKPTLSKGTN